MKYQIPALRDVVGKNYDDFLYSQKRFLVCKGGRASKKSRTVAIKLIYNMMKLANLKPYALVVRHHLNDNWDSTRKELIWAINRFGVADLWKVPKAEYTLTFKPTGQQILFRGLYDSLSITSITAGDGFLCWVWFEEAYQIRSENDFDKIDGSIRGIMPKGLFPQITLTFNPWSDKTWLKRRFFDSPDDSVFTKTTTYKDNEFISENDLAYYENMKEKNPRRYEIEGLGNWGISEGLIYYNWEIQDFDVEKTINAHLNERTATGQERFIHSCGLDFGYNDPTAFVSCWFDMQDEIVYINYEYFKVHALIKDIANDLTNEHYNECYIVADSASPGLIAEFLNLGFYDIVGAKKEHFSVQSGIKKLQNFKFVVKPCCVNTIDALSNYCWKKSKIDDKLTDEPEHEYSHIPDAIRYASERAFNYQTVLWL